VSRLATPRARIRMQSPGYRLVHLDVGDHVGFSWPRLYDDQARPLKNQIGLIEEVAVDGDNPQVALTIRDTGAYLSRGQRLDGAEKFGFTSLSGSVSSANLKISIAPGNAFADLAGVDLSPFVGRVARLTLTDTDGKKLIGWIKEAGTGETLGAELIAATADRDFSSDTGWWSKYAGVSITAGVARFSASFGWLWRAGILVDGGLYKTIYTLSGYSSGTFQFWAHSKGGPGHSANGTYTDYGWAFGGTGAYWGASVGSITVDMDNVSMKQVLTPSATGARIVSTPGGSTYSWESEAAGFNRASGSFTWLIDGWNLWKFGADRDQRDY
jgi:hypothetical protein